MDNPVVEVHAPAILNRKEVNPLLTRVYVWLSSRPDDGQGLAEYALILALIAIIAILALLFLGSQISDILSNTGTSI